MLSLIRQLDHRLFDALQRTFGRRLLLATGTLLLALGLGGATSEIHFRLIFYATVAQVLPVLLLVAVVEGRYFRHLDRRDQFDRFFLKGLLFTPMIGETAALACLALGRDDLILRGAVLLALVTTGVLLFVYASLGPIDATALRATTTLQVAEHVKQASQTNRPIDSESTACARDTRPASSANRSKLA